MCPFSSPNTPPTSTKILCIALDVGLLSDSEKAIHNLSECASSWREIVKRLGNRHFYLPPFPIAHAHRKRNRT
jgi:hypothetical protein